MKRGTPTHPKTLAFAERLTITRAHAVGLLECLFHWAGGYARRGDIGRHTNAAISDGAGWILDPDAFVQALLASRWIDRCCQSHRLRIHDWPEHADNAVKRSPEVKAAGFLECYSSGAETRGNPKDSSMFHTRAAIRREAEGGRQESLTVISNECCDWSNIESVTRFYLGCFNACFERRCTINHAIRERVAKCHAVWGGWKIVAQPILVFANTRDPGFRKEINPEWPLRDGKHPRTNGQGFVNGGTDWMAREYNRIDKTVLDERLESIAKTYGVLDRLMTAHVSVRKEIA